MLHRLSQAHARAAPVDAPERQLRGRWLLIARAAWAASILLLLGLYALAFPWRYLQGDPLPNQIIARLAQLGISRGAYATFVIVRELISVLTHLAIAALIVWRKPANGLALFVALMLVLFGTAGEPTMATLARHYPALAPLAELAVTALVGGLMLFLFIFPTARFVPRWTRLFLTLWLVWFVAMRIITGVSILDEPDWSGMTFIDGLSVGVVA
jgi:hypothetical protein